jgi:FKBP-type peptidyl-prolyl cis-trans isomerase FklB
MIKLCCAAMILASVSTTTLAESTAPALNDAQKLSYILGQNTAANLLRQEIEVETKFFLQGMNDLLNKKPSKLSDAEKQAVIMKFQQALQAKAKAKSDDAAAKNIEAGKAFIIDYKSKKDVVSLDNGMTYKVIKDGSGVQPMLTDTVTAHYTGKLIDGTTFDSSIPRGQPSSFPLANVIKGWQEILPMMKVGAKWEVVIPPQLAYGEAGAGKIIGPMATLVFEIELLEVKSK